MRFIPAPLNGAFVVEVERARDMRGSFARTACELEFAAHGLEGRFVQSSISHNIRRATVRGMHMQLPPSKEAKLVRVSKGAIFDVIVDMRPDSSSYLRHFSVELDSRRANALYIPPLMAHGFQTLEEHCEVFYQMTDYYAPSLGFGFRWDDPAFSISWPIGSGATVLARDEKFAAFDEAHYRKKFEEASRV